MRQHNNLCYLFLEELSKTALPETHRVIIQKILKFFQKYKTSLKVTTPYNQKERQFLNIRRKKQ